MRLATHHSIPMKATMTKLKTIGHQCINLHPGKSSHLLLIHKTSVNNPLVTQVKDLFDDTIVFDPVETVKVNPHRAFVRIERAATMAPVAATARGRRAAATATFATIPTDGLLSITLIDETTSGSGTGPEVDVGDVPVDYIDDPAAP